MFLKDFAGAGTLDSRKKSKAKEMFLCTTKAYMHTLTHSHICMYVCIRGRIKKRDKDSNQLIIIIYGS